MIGQRIRQLRKDRNLTQALLADQFGITQQAVAKWEQEKSFPDPGTLSRLSGIFDVSVDYLLGISDFPQESGSGAMVPVVGSVRAGYNALAFDDPIGSEPSGVGNARDYCYLLVRGDSMEPFIHDGDLALVRRQPTLEDGDLGVVVYGEGEGTLKKFSRKGHAVVLTPFNSEYAPIELSGIELEQLVIIGKVIETKTKW